MKKHLAHFVVAVAALVENEYRRMLGVTKVIWVPTGIVEDQGTFRGPQATHIHVPEFDGVEIPHAGVYTTLPTNGHADEFLRFVAPDTVVLAQETVPTTPVTTPQEELLRWIQERNRERLSSSGKRVQVRVVGASRLDGVIGWVDEDDVESAGETCPAAYSPN